jgi:chromate transporter
MACSFLDGVNAAAVALMAFVGYQFALAALINWPLMAIAIVSAFLVFRYQVNSTWLVLGGAMAGLLLHSLGKI